MRCGWLAIGVTAVVAVSACGGDGGSTGGGVDGGVAAGGSGGKTAIPTNVAGASGAPAAVTLGMLNQEQLTKVCNWSAAKSSVEAQDGCVLIAIVKALQAGVHTDAAVRTTCKAVYDECLMDSAPAAVCNPVPAGCSATVGDFETCSNDEAKALHEFVSQIPSCDTLMATYDPTASGPSYNTPASCTSYDNKCSGYVPGQPPNAQAQCEKLIDVLCSRLAMCAAGTDAGTFSVDDCKAQLDCSQAMGVSATYDQCLADFMTQSCADYDANKTPASCNQVLQ